MKYTSILQREYTLLPVQYARSTQGNQQESFRLSVTESGEEVWLNLKTGIEYQLLKIKDDIKQGLRLDGLLYEIGEPITESELP